MRNQNQSRQTIVGNHIATTPKPRAGEHKRWADQYDFDRSDPATRLFVAASNWVDRCEVAEAERDLLRERERELVEALRALTELCDNVPIFQLDDGNASVKAVRLAGKFTAAHKAAHTLLAKEKTA